MKPVTLAIIGAGSRGNAYAEYAQQNPERAKVVAVAEPREVYREKMARAHSIKKENIFSDWKSAAAQDRLADAVIIATPDSIHTEPAIAFANKKYHILLEKPMAISEKDCRAIVSSVLANKVFFAVCHVLRYTKYTQHLKKIIESNVIGDVVSIQHLEPVGYWHHAHSYVRGNWRNQESSTFMLMAKSCHDLDWLRYITGSKCKSISSFGNLKHFKRENKPKDAAARCISCQSEPACPYSARKIYVGRASKDDFGWPVDVITPDLSMEGVNKSLRDGPYGRCVYDCDNNVVDHQVVNMLFENGVTATFTMTAFSRQADRKTRIFGTRGELYGNGTLIKHYDFLHDETTTIEINASEGTVGGGHGGGDYELMRHFIDAVSTNNPSHILTGPQETLETHLMVFGAERARTNNTVINL